jgi:hypothetical protein
LNSQNGHRTAEKIDFYQRQFLLEILTFGGLGEQDDCSLTTESCTFGGKFAQNLYSQPPKACFNQNFRNFAQIKDF